MAHRLIGIDTDGSSWRIAVLQVEKGRTRLLRVGEHAPDASLAATLATLLDGPVQSGDRFCASLPGRSGWVRQLRFPFAERRAIAAALPLELAGQLPLPLDACAVVSLDPVAVADGATVLAAAARSEVLGAALAPFEAAGVPLQTLDLLPFAVAVGSAALFPAPTLLLLVGERETVLLRLVAGQLCDWRLLPHPEGAPVLLLPLLVQTLGSLRSGAEDGADALLLAGVGADANLRDALREAGYPCELARPLLDGQPLPATDLTAVALALRAGRGGANFRRGAFAQQGTWAPLRRRLLLAAALLVLTVAAVASAAVLGYLHRARRAEALKQELTAVYRGLVPGQGAVVDPLLQLQGKIVELERSTRLGGADRAHTPLAVLRELSKLVPGELSVEFRDFNWTPDEVRIEGTAGSFDAAARLGRLLEASPLFAAARLTDTRALAEAGRVEFRLTLPFHRVTEQRR